MDLLAEPRRSSTDSDEFYDAQDLTPTPTASSSRANPSSVKHKYQTRSQKSIEARRNFPPDPGTKQKTSLENSPETEQKQSESFRPTEHDDDEIESSNIPNTPRHNSKKPIANMILFPSPSAFHSPMTAGSQSRQKVSPNLPSVNNTDNFSGLQHHNQGSPSSVSNRSAKNISPGQKLKDLNSESGFGPMSSNTMSSSLMSSKASTTTTFSYGRSRSEDSASNAEDEGTNPTKPILKLNLLPPTPRHQNKHLQHIPATSILSPSLKKTVDHSSKRRRNLDCLRRRMQVDTKEEREHGAELQSCSESDSESALTVSWEKNFPASGESKASTLPLDTRGSCGASGANLGSGLGAGNKSSSSYSSGSSKSNTLDRYSTPDTSKSNSLDRGLRGPPTKYSSKSHSSLSRELSLSGGECSLLSLEGPEVADAIRRKNSEAAQLIEKLASEIVRGNSFKKVDENKQGSSSSPGAGCSSSPASLERPKLLFLTDSSAAGSSAVNTGTAAAAVSQPETNRASSLSNVGEEQPESVIRTIKNGNLQPDIVASTVRLPTNTSIPGSLGLDTKSDFVIPSHPIPPPRRRKHNIHNDPASYLEERRRNSLIRGLSNASRITMDDTMSIASCPVASREVSQRRTVDCIPLRNLDTAEEFNLSDLNTSGRYYDPLTVAAQKRLSIHPGNVSYAASTISSMQSEDTDSDMQSIRSMPISKEDEHSYLSSARSLTRKVGSRISRKVGKTVHAASSKMKNVADEMSDRLHGGEHESTEEEMEDNTSEASRVIRVRARHHKKGPFDFEQLRQVQEITGEHSGAVWCLKFSPCGRLLATAGQDNVIRVWVMRDAYKCFNDMRIKYNTEATNARERSSSSSNLAVDPYSQLVGVGLQIGEGEESEELGSPEDIESAEDMWAPFVKKPFCSYRGHTADILDIAWSKNYFLLSGGMDRTVRLWHISRTECLCCFQHIDFVTCVSFLPKDDKFFLSGSLDGKLRVWNITEKKVALWNEVEGNRLITALTFVNNGKFAVVGTFDGKCVFYTTDHLKYHTMIDVKSSRGKNARGHKVTGLSVYHDKTRGDKLLVTSNDSRIRLYDLSNLSLTCKYKGVSNYSSQIRATFSPDGKHIVCGSEDKYIYLWRTTLDTLTLSVRKDRNGMWERVRAHNDVVTAAIFAPKPELIFQQIERAKHKMTVLGITSENVPGTPIASGSSKPYPGNHGNMPKPRIVTGDVIVTADFAGKICVFTNRTKVKAGASVFFSGM